MSNPEIIPLSPQTEPVRQYLEDRPIPQDNLVLQFLGSHLEQAIFTHRPELSQTEIAFQTSSIITRFCHQLHTLPSLCFLIHHVRSLNSESPPVFLYELAPSSLSALQDATSPDALGITNLDPAEFSCLQQAISLWQQDQTSPNHTTPR